MVISAWFLPSQKRPLILAFGHFVPNGYISLDNPLESPLHDGCLLLRAVDQERPSMGSVPLGGMSSSVIA
jgi:hypothetical protein